MLVEHSFVTTLESGEALDRIQEVIVELDFRIERRTDSHLTARRGLKSPARARSLRDLPQGLQADFDRGRIDMAISVEVRRKALDLYRDMLLGVAKALEARVTGGLTAEKAVEALRGLHRRLDREAFRRQIRRRIVVLAVALAVAGAMVVAALMVR